MKKALYIIATLAVVACSKTEVYETAGNGELVVVPVSSNITKAAITDGVYPESNHLSLFAYHAPGVAANDATDDGATDYTKFVERYLYDTEYYYTGSDVYSTKIWAGLKSSYYWPITGSLVFAGYSLQAPTTEGERAESPKIGTKVEYTLASDKLEIEGYTQSLDPESTFDFLYFGRTDRSYNNRRTGAAIPLTFKHALSWITVKVMGGTGALVDGRKWAVKNVKLSGVKTIGDFTYTGTAAEPKVVWDNLLSAADTDFVIYDSEYTDKNNVKAGAKELTSSMEIIENVTDGTLVIPQAATTLLVTIQYNSPAGALITEIVDIDLADYTTTGWEAGKRYVYELSFSPQEITVAPRVETWPDPISANLPTNI